MPANSQSGSPVVSSHPREAAGLRTAPRTAGNPSASSYWFPERGNRNNTEPELRSAPRPGSRLAGILQRPGPHCAWRHQVTGPLHSPCGNPKSPHPVQTPVQGSPGDVVPGREFPSFLESRTSPIRKGALCRSPGLPRLCLLSGQRQERERGPFGSRPGAYTVLPLPLPGPARRQQGGFHAYPPPLANIGVSDPVASSEWGSYAGTRKAHTLRGGGRGAAGELQG